MQCLQADILIKHNMHPAFVYMHVCGSPIADDHEIIQLWKFSCSYNLAS